jgi:membrane protein
MAVNPNRISGQLERMQAQVKTIIDDDAVASEEPRLNGWQRFVHFWLLVFQNFVRNRCPVRASALAYTTLLAVVPLLAVSISVAALFLPRDEARQKRELEDLIDAAVVRVAPAIGMNAEDTSDPTSPVFSADDYSGLRVLTERITQATNPVCKFLWERMTPEARELTVSWDGTDAGRLAVENALSKMFNGVIAETNFYSPDRFAGVSLSPAVRTLIGTTNPPPDLRRMNRLLLQEVFPKEIVPMADPSDPTSQTRTKRSEVAAKIVEFVGNIRFGTVGASAMAGLLFVAISLLRTVESAFNDIWGVPKGRTWFMSIVLYWAVITLGPIAVVLGKGVNYLALLHHAGGGEAFAVVAQVIASLSWLITLGIMSLAFAGLYLWMPNTRVQWQAALVGGVVAAVLWTLNGRLSALYNTRVVTYNAIYGSLGLVPLFLLGMYLSWLILLFGAQTAYVFQFRHAYLQERWVGRVHHQAREFIALRLMTLIGERFANGDPPYTGGQLAERMAVPPKLAKDVLQTLFATHLLCEAAGSEVGYLPARPLNQINVWQILHSIRAGQGHDVLTAADDARPLVRAEFDAIAEVEAGRARSTTLEHLVQRTQGAPG